MARESVVTITVSEYRRLIEADVKNKIFAEWVKYDKYLNRDDVKAIIGTQEEKIEEIIEDVADDF